MVISSVQALGFLPWNGSFPSLVRAAVTTGNLVFIRDAAFFHFALRTVKGKRSVGEKGTEHFPDT